MIRKAVILAAGRGTRMGELTADLPKPMLPVQGRPMLDHILERLAGAGVEEYLIVVGYRREVIKEHLRGWPRPITFIVQERVDGTGSATRLAREFATGPFLLTFGDIMVGTDAYRNCARILTTNPETGVVLGVKDLDDPWRGAAVYEVDGRITRVVEKPPKGTSTTRWGSAGLYAMRPVVFEYLDRLQPPRAASTN
jgi:NDP-sugar pyrophosphorylase family protein